MSVFHRVDDITTLSGPVFFKLAWRLPAYQGVMAARARAAEGSGQPATANASAAPRSSPAASGPRRVVPATKAALSMDPAFKGILSFGSGKGGR
jgi:hypothetical protein